MLRTRVATALVLVAMLAAAALWSQVALVVLAALFIGAAMYEWLHLTALSSARSLVAAMLFAAALLGLELAGRRPAPPQLAMLAAGACLGWIAIAALLVAAQRRQRPGARLGRALSAALAVLLLAVAWWSLTALLRHGILWVLSVLALVWIADIAAYFSGRAFGRAKLASQISPGKTWAGVWGAIFAVIVLAAGLRALWPDADLWSTQLLQARPVLGVAVLVAVVALSVVGDLFESLVKRQAGAKDSGRLLPGHGGVWDRIDATLPVLPAAVLVQWWIAMGR